MSFRDCILQNPALSPKQAEQLAKEYDDLAARYTQTMGTATGAQAAAKKYAEAKAQTIQRKKENTIRDVLAWQSVSSSVDEKAAAYKALKAEAAPGGRWLFGKSNVAAATRQILENTYTRQQALQRRAELSIAELIEKYRSKNAGLTQDVEGFTNVVRAVLGESVDGPAQAEGRAIREVFDLLHKQYQQAGGILGRIDNYFPQGHNPQAVGSVPYREWADFIRPLLDRDRMPDPDTGLPFTDAGLDVAMREAYQGIRTNGLNEVARRAAEGKQSFGGGGGVAMRHSSARFFHFRDADAFLAYNRTFGHGDSGLFDTMLGHIQAMTRDTAIMQELGPNPAGQLERLKLKVQADGAAPQAERTIQGMYDVLAGRTSYSGELPTWYRAVVGTQNWLRSTLLGSAPVSAMSDSFFAAWTAKANGLPATGVMKQYFKLLNPASSADRRVGRRIAFISSAASGTSLAAARFADDMGSHGLTGWLANFTNRASGLGVMTDAVRQAPVLEAQGFFAEARASKLTWKNLPEPMKAAFARHGMTEADYRNIVAATPHVDPDTAADFIRPEDVPDVETGAKYERWLVGMAQQSSNEPRLLTRAIATGAALGDARPGTALRATASSAMMFKSFGITVLMNHVLPALQHAATAKGVDRLSRLGPLLLMTTLLGGMSIQARQYVQGKEARETDEKFWLAAMAQGGGFGIFGDFLFQDYSRVGQTFASTLGGPVVGLGNDVYRVFKGNFDRSLDEGTETKFFADAYQLAERNIPGVKLWYTRLFLERLMLDQLERAIDSRFDERMRRIEGKMKKDYGQEFYWAPGDFTPQ